jgi:glycosyltransferase involved in cell wall biosynthesis
VKIAIVNNCVPFIAGGAEHLADALQNQLTERGHQAMLVRIPFRWSPAEHIVDHVLACRLLSIQGVDRVIALKFPAYYVPHENKVLWLLHQFRQAYDLWGTRYQDIPLTPDGLKVQRIIIESDNQYLPEARKIYTNSQVTANRLKQFNNLDSEVLYPPLNRSSHFRCSSYKDYIFYPGRITSGKRQALVVEALGYCKSPVRLVIAGQPELPTDREAIEIRIRQADLESRVEFIPRFITEEEKAALFADALGCAYTPYDEDSYGYVTLEAYHSRKPVITCSDSGGVMLLVKDGETGLVVPPEPRAIADAMDRLYASNREAKRMGEAGYDLMKSLGITWDRVVERLTA